MRLKYELTMMDMGGEIAAVPTGSNASEFRWILKVNDVARDILEQLKEDTTPDKIHICLKKKYPESSDEEIRKVLDNFLDRLSREGLLIVP